MRITNFIMFVLSLAVLAGCMKKPDLSSEEASLAGTWQEYELNPQFSSGAYRFTFKTGNHVEVKILSLSNANGSSNPCSNSHTSYAMGTYSLYPSVPRQIFFQGTYCDSNFSITAPNCAGDTIYGQTFYIYDQNKSFLKFGGEPGSNSGTDYIYLYKQ